MLIGLHSRERSDCVKKNNGEKSERERAVSGYSNVLELLTGYRCCAGRELASLIDCVKQAKGLYGQCSFLVVSSGGNDGDLVRCLMIPAAGQRCEPIWQLFFLAVPLTGRAALF